MSQTLPDGCTVLFREEEVLSRVKLVARELTAKFSGRNPIFLITLKGGFVFAAHLIQAMETELEVAFVQPSSYKDGDRSGKMDILLDIKDKLSGRDVIVIEDIIDSGQTTGKLMELVHAKRPASVTMVTLIDRPNSYPPIQLDYCCLTYEGDMFLLGWGLDYNQGSRHLRDIVTMPRPSN